MISTHSPAILKDTSTNETLRIHRATTASRPGLTDAEHEVLVREAMAALRQSELGSSDAIATEEATGGDFDPRTVEIRVIVYDDARFVLMDVDGHVVIEIDAQGREKGRTARETLNVQRVSMETAHADDIEVFINDRQLPVDAIFNAQQRQVYLDLSHYAE